MQDCRIERVQILTKIRVQEKCKKGVGRRSREGKVKRESEKC